MCSEYTSRALQEQKVQKDTVPCPACAGDNPRCQLCGSRGVVPDFQARQYLDTKEREKEQLRTLIDKNE